MESVVDELSVGETDEGARTKSARRPWWQSQPSTAFARDPYFYFKYDFVWLCLFSAVVVAAHMTGWTGLGLTWTSLWAIPALLVGCYVQVLAGVCVHNCTHGNFPRPINRLVGETLGVIIGTRYASWEILHKRHHAFTDDVEKDPHPLERSFWSFFIRKMIMGLETSIRNQSFERFGETPRMVKLDKMRTVFSFLVGMVMLAFWQAALGTVGFFYAFLPSLVVGAIHVSHFNWATHRGWADDGDFHPVNLNHGLYKLGNFLCFGLYFHANHHAFPTYFDPGKLPPEKVARVEQRLAAMAPKTA